MSVDDSFVRVVCFNVGHGASTLVSLPPLELGGPRRYGVIDTNEASAASLVEYYLRQPPFDDEPPLTGHPLMLEFVALTHFDFDHFKGMAYLLGQDRSPLRAKRFLGPPFNPLSVAETRFVPNSDAYEELCTIAKLAYLPTRRDRRLGKAPQLCVLLSGKQYQWFADIEILALAPLDDVVTKPRITEARGNLASGALRLRFDRKHVFVLGGDVEEGDWREIASRFPSAAVDPLTANVVTVPHHGGQGNHKDIWERFSRLVPSGPLPEKRELTVGVISCGDGDPQTRDETFVVLAKSNCSVRCTNPSQPCRDKYRERGEQPPCLQRARAGEAEPIMNFAASEDKEWEDVLCRFSEPLGPFDGTVCVDLKRGQPPLVRHLGRIGAKYCLDPWRDGQVGKNSSY
jgi:hypothetical protein